MKHLYEITGAGHSAVMEDTGAMSNVFNHWSHGRWYETPLLMYWHSLPKPDIVVDVGAHAGNHSVWAGKEWPGARIVAFEPNPMSWRRLVSNVNRNGVTAQTRCAAAWDRHGTARLTKYGEDDGQYRIDDTGEIPIYVETIDGALGDVMKCRILIKIDAESENPPILRGAMRTLWANDCHLFIEAATDEDKRLTGATLDALGYEWTGGVWGATPMYEAVKP